MAGQINNKLDITYKSLPGLFLQTHWIRGFITENMAGSYPPGCDNKKVENRA
jgi:hypothetical protein